MSNVVARTIFNTAVVERSWKTYVTSGFAHAAVIAAAFLLIVPAVQEFEEHPVRDHVTLIAPIIPKIQPYIEPPHIQHSAKLTVPRVPPPVVKPVVIPPRPEPKPVAKALPPPSVPIVDQPRIVPELKPELPPAPKPVVKTGTFQEVQLAKAEPVAKQVTVGGFGDPRGVQNSDTAKPSPVLMAKVGAFASPIGSGTSGGGGHLDSGGVKQSGFGSAGVVNGAPSGNGKAPGTIRTGGFGDTTTAAPQHRDPASGIAATTPVEILFKPRPSYTEEARSLRLEGQVSLEVVFQASGAVKVVRVIKGLGHGLDEAAQQAALQVRFKPATRGGSVVDTNATINITFELT